MPPVSDSAKQLFEMHRQKVLVLSHKAVARSKLLIQGSKDLIAKSNKVKQASRRILETRTSREMHPSRKAA